MEACETTGLERPRRRRLSSFFAITLSVALFGSAAAWVIQTYVAPPVMAVYQPLLLAAQGAIAEREARPAAEPSPVPEPQPVETTGSAAAVPEPPPPLSKMVMASLAIVPPFSHPWNGTVAAAAASPSDTPAENVVADGEPIAGPIPLPQPRPRISTAGVRSTVPLPRPRPN